MEVPKIHLSSAEKELVQNADIILTKNSVLQKIRMLLTEVQEMQVTFINSNGLNTIDPFFIEPKISKGENYLGLPYIILDYPRLSENQNLFFCRTMFWWGKYFSITLQLSGKYKLLYLQKIKSSFTKLQDYSIGVNEDPWLHHFGEDNYRSIRSVNHEEFQNLCESFEHLKIAVTLPLDGWNELSSELFERWKYLLKVCGLVS